MEQELSAKETNLEKEQDIKPIPKKVSQRKAKTEELQNIETKGKTKTQSKKKSEIKPEQKEKKEEKRQPEIISHIKSELPTYLL